MSWISFNFFGKFKKKNSNNDIQKNNFEDIKIFKSLPKEDWKRAYNELNESIGLKLEEHGFIKKGRKHYRLTNDLLEVIDIDNRGSWSGSSDTFEIRIGLVPYCWIGLTDNYYLMGSKRIEEIDKTIRKHFRLSQEYMLLANYLSERIINNVLPFLEKYNSTKKIISEPYIFPYFTNVGGSDIYNSHYLILFSEIKQHKCYKAIEILENEITYNNSLGNKEILNSWIELKNLIENENWNEIDSLLMKNEKRELEKLRLGNL